MKKHERLLEEYEDAYFALLMEEVAKKEGERLEALNEALQSDPEAVVPESLDKRCMETIRRHFAHQQRRSALRKTGKVLRLVAVLMAVTVLLFTTAFAVSEEFRVATLNLMLTITEEYTQFSIKASDGTGGIKKPPAIRMEKVNIFKMRKLDGFRRDLYAVKAIMIHTPDLKTIWENSFMFPSALEKEGH